MESGPISPDKLDLLRKKAVMMRLRKRTLDEIQAETGLSHPTIIAAFKKYNEGGWAAVLSKNSGRPIGRKRIGSFSVEALLCEFAKKHSQDNRLSVRHELWTPPLVKEWLERKSGDKVSVKSVQRYLQDCGFIGTNKPLISRDNALSLSTLSKPAILVIGLRDIKIAGATFYQLYVTDLRNSTCWQQFLSRPKITDLLMFLEKILDDSSKNISFVSKLPYIERDAAFLDWFKSRKKRVEFIPYMNLCSAGKCVASVSAEKKQDSLRKVTPSGESMPLTHLQRLEAESIQIMREVVAGAENPVMLYSIGKDSAVMLHIALKAFYPSLPPFPLLHVDTTWKFQDMYEFRDKMVKDLGLELLTYTNPEGLDKGINPFTHGSAIHTDIMKTEALKQALYKYGFDAAFGGARRDEEKSRAKERIFSFRTSNHRWDPKNQRPELWKQYNSRKHKGESIRVFPLSNWTELDIWQYIYLENIPIVPLYYSAERPVVERDGVLIMVDDERMPLLAGEIPMMKSVRFRTLGCYPLTGAVESKAKTLPDIIQEMLLTSTSERQGRVIDHDSAASMEKKKQEGYF